MIASDLSWNSDPLPIPLHRTTKLNEFRVLQLLNHPVFQYSISLVLRGGVPTRQFEDL